MTRATAAPSPARQPAVWAVLLGAFLLRVVPYAPSVLHQGHVDIADPDAAYHARRILQGAATFPSLPVFDPDQNAPYGALSVWSPGYDWVMAGAARLLEAGGATESGVLAILVWAPPILGTLAVGGVYLIARRLLPGGWAALAAALAGALPRGIFYTAFGNVDHHAAEALALIGGGVAWCRLAESGRGWVALGLWLAWAHLVWLGSPLFVVMLSGATLWLHRVTGEAPWNGFGRSLALAGALLIPPALPHVAAGIPILSFRHFSLFQPLGLLIGGAGAMAVGAWRTRPRAAVVWGIGAVLGLLLLSQPAGKGVLYAAHSGDPDKSLAGESESLYLYGGRLSPKSAVEMLGYVWGVWPFAIIWFIRRPGGFAPAAWAWTASGAAVTTLLAISQNRFVPHFGYLASPCLVAGAREVTERLTPRLGAATARAALGCLVAGLFIPLAYIFSPGEEATTLEYRSVEPALAWLRTETPPGSTILADWTVGNWILHAARRRVVVDNFRNYAADMRRGAGVILAPTDRAGLAAARASGIRFVMVRSPLLTVISALGMLGEPVNDLMAMWTDPRRPDRWNQVFSPRLTRTVGFGLYQGRSVPGFRLRAEFPDPYGQALLGIPSRIRIYEVSLKS